MSQIEELKEVKRKIRALLNMTISKGASEAEASFAMDRVGRLLNQYKLTLGEIELRDEACVEIRIGTGTKKRSQNVIWGRALANFCGVRMWTSKQPKEIVWCFFGLEPDVQMAEYLVRVIQVAMKNSVADFKKTPEYINASEHRKRLSNSFVNGMSRRLEIRLKELTVKASQEIASSSTDLMIIAKDSKIETEFSKLGLKLRKININVRTTSSDSWHAGATAANSVNLSRPVTQNGPGTLLIGKD